MKKTQKLLAALRSDYGWPDKAFISEFRGGTGWSRESRADAIAMDLWPSKGLELIGFELKTSRTDWLRELKQPDKCESIKQFCDRWYLVVDDLSIVRWDELPNGWGLIAPAYNYYSEGKVKIEREAPKLDPKPIDRLFLASLMRLAGRDFQEIMIDGRRYIPQSPPASEEIPQ